MFSVKTNAYAKRNDSQPAVKTLCWFTAFFFQLTFLALHKDRAREILDFFLNGTSLVRVIVVGWVGGVLLEVQADSLGETQTKSTNERPKYTLIFA